MKKILYFMVLIATIFSLAACASLGTPETSQEKIEETSSVPSTSKDRLEETSSLESESSQGDDPATIDSSTTTKTKVFLEEAVPMPPSERKTFVLEPETASVREATIQELPTTHKATGVNYIMGYTIPEDENKAKFGNIPPQSLFATDLATGEGKIISGEFSLYSFHLSEELNLIFFRTNDTGFLYSMGLDGENVKQLTDFSIERSYTSMYEHNGLLYYLETDSVEDNHETIKTMKYYDAKTDSHGEAFVSPEENTPPNITGHYDKYLFVMTRDNGQPLGWFYDTVSGEFKDMGIRHINGHTNDGYYWYIKVNDSGNNLALYRSKLDSNMNFANEEVMVEGSSTALAFDDWVFYGESSDSFDSFYNAQSGEFSPIKSEPLNYWVYAIEEE